MLPEMISCVVPISHVRLFSLILSAPYFLFRSNKQRYEISQRILPVRVVRSDFTHS